MGLLMAQFKVALATLLILGSAAFAGDGGNGVPCNVTVLGGRGLNFDPMQNIRPVKALLEAAGSEDPWGTAFKTAAQAGQTENLLELAGGLANVAVRRGWDPERVDRIGSEELIQEALIRTWMDLPNLNPSLNVVGRVGAVVRGALVDTYRREKLATQWAFLEDLIADLGELSHRNEPLTTGEILDDLRATAKKGQAFNLSDLNIVEAMVREPDMDSVIQRLNNGSNSKSGTFNRYFETTLHIRKDQLGRTAPPAAQLLVLQSDFEAELARYVSRTERNKTLHETQATLARQWFVERLPLKSIDAQQNDITNAVDAVLRYLRTVWRVSEIESRRVFVIPNHPGEIEGLVRGEYFLPRGAITYSDLNRALRNLSPQHIGAIRAYFMVHGNTAQVLEHYPKLADETFFAILGQRYKGLGLRDIYIVPDAMSEYINPYPL